jgi:hypothetical protein
VVLYRPLTTEPLSDSYEASKAQTRCNLESKRYVKKEKRGALLDSMPDEEYVLEFCEGNPGCATVIARIADYVEIRPVVITSVKPVLVQLVDMNIRGSQLWVLYKDLFNGDIPKLIKAILERDPVMIERLNAIVYHPDDDNPIIPYHQQAVVGGWKPE